MNVPSVVAAVLEAEEATAPATWTRPNPMTHGRAGVTTRGSRRTSRRWTRGATSSIGTAALMKAGMPW
jgi:hypothetical protein